MNKCLTYVAMLALLAALAVHADWQDLHGKVTDESGTPLEHAIVTLESSGATVLTKGDGTFSFGQNASINEKIVPGSQSARIHVQNGIVHFGAGANDATVTISVFDLNGALVRKRRLRVDNAGLELQTIMPSAKGVYLLQLLVNGSTTRFRATRLGCNDIRASVVKNALPKKKGSLAKSAAIPDSVLARKYGYGVKLVKINSYNEMQLIELSASGAEAAPPGMRRLDGGQFERGSPNGNPDERPMKTITVSPFYIDTTEVTQADYESLLGLTPWRDYTGWFPAGESFRRPAWHIVWYDAVFYCNARSKRDGLDTVYSYSGITGIPGNGCAELKDLVIDYDKAGYRLPTEAEWEYAAKAGTNTTYYWGESHEPDVVSEYAWWMKNSPDSCQIVASKLPNAFGLYDMLGNIHEFCSDLYATSYYHNSDEYVNPTGPAGGTGGHRNLRGGSYESNYHLIRAADRASVMPYWREESMKCRIGFRCILPIRE